MIVLNKISQLLISIFILTSSSLLWADAPHIDPADDHKHFGSPENSLFWTPKQQVAGYRNQDKIVPTRLVSASDTPLLLPLQLRNLDSVKITYKGRTKTIDELFTSQNVAGLLVIKNGNIVYERYGLGNTKASRWISYSVAKSVTSMLIGAAIKDGYINSVDEKITAYLPRLKGSSYDQSTIRNILQMSSGIAWNEDYADPKADINQATWPTMELYQYLSKLKRDASPGEKFNYNTAETNLVGNLLRSAIGNNLSTYLSEKIWKPFGMESDASWGLTSPGGGEWGGCCINATLRDYGRIGMFALDKGKLADGTEVLSNDWMRESTTPSKPFPGYGYLWWLQPNGSYQATGVFGQGIRIDPMNKVVIALHSARAAASKPSDWNIQDEMFNALTKAVSD